MLKLYRISLLFELKCVTTYYCALLCVLLNFEVVMIMKIDIVDRQICFISINICISFIFDSKSMYGGYFLELLMSGDVFKIVCFTNTSTCKTTTIDSQKVASDQASRL